MPNDIVVPAEQEGTKAVLKTWLKKRGDAVRLDEPIVEIETDKVAVEIAATANGVLSEILIEEGADVSPGSVLGRITEGAAVKESQRAAAPSGKADLHIARSAEISAQLSPGIRRLLSEHGLKPEDVAQKGDRLTREDIEAEVARRAKKPSVPSASVRVVPHDFMRRRIAEHM